MITLGVDYSMTSPAVCAISDSGDISVICYGKKKIQGKIQAGNISIEVREYPEWNSEIERFDRLSSDMMKFISDCEDAFCRIEGYSMGAKGRVFNLAENCGLLKYKLWCNKIDYDVIAPTALKKYATGKGNSGKWEMYEAFVKETGINLKDFLSDNTKEGAVGSPCNDIVDAYFLAKSKIDKVSASKS